MTSAALTAILNTLDLCALVILAASALYAMTFAPLPGDEGEGGL